ERDAGARRGARSGHRSGARGGGAVRRPAARRAGSGALTRRPPGDRRHLQRQSGLAALGGEVRPLAGAATGAAPGGGRRLDVGARSEEHTSELQSPCNLVCRLLLEKKKKKITKEQYVPQNTQTYHPAY